MAKISFTKQELMSELVEIVNSISSSIDEAMGPDFYRAALGLPLEHDHGEISKALIFENISQFPVTLALEVLYIFAIEGYWRQDISVEQIGACLDEVEGFSDLASRSYSTHPETNAKYWQLHDIAEARYFLEFSPDELDLTLRQIALLANVDERTVRNAASSKGQDRLPIIKHGGRTYVERKEAMAWLLNRPGFRLTELVPAPTDEQVRTGWAQDPIAFGSFISTRRSQLGLSHEALIKRLGLGHEKIPALLNLEMGIKSIDLSEVTLLATGLGENPTELVKRFMCAYYPAEYALLITDGTLLEDRLYSFVEFLKEMLGKLRASGRSPIYK